VKVKANGYVFTALGHFIYCGRARKGPKIVERPRIEKPQPAAPPVEYAVAVDRYLAAARISPASRRVYRVTLDTWGWLLVGRTPPTGTARRGANSPVVLLSRLDGNDAETCLHEALSRRALMIDRRTYEREVSILRNAAHWWAAQGWIGPEAESALKGGTDVHRADLDAPTTHSAEIDVARLFELRAPLREQTLWRLVYESAAPIEHLLALDVSELDLRTRKVRRKGDPRQADRISWSDRSAELLPLLMGGRAAGPLFLTERRAAARVPAADRCPYTGRARLSARRAAELFQAATSRFDPRGEGWNLRDLRLAGRRAADAGGRTSTSRTR
jgi:integrase